MQPGFDTPFRRLTHEENSWLSQWQCEGAKQLALDALLVCMTRVGPAATGSPVVPLSPTELEDNLKRWYGACYPGTTFHGSMDQNIWTANAIHEHWVRLGRGNQLRAIAGAFLSLAVAEYDQLMASGRPDHLEFWRRVLAESEESEA